MLKIGKCTELKVASWFLQEGWDVFVPVEDSNAMDLVVRNPDLGKLFSLQVKAKELDSLNQGQIQNHWSGIPPPFDFLIFYQPLKDRGFVFPGSLFTNRGVTIFLFNDDVNGYSTGDPRKIFAPYFFDLSTMTEPDKGTAVVALFRRLSELPDPSRNIEELR